MKNNLMTYLVAMGVTLFTLSQEASGQELPFVLADFEELGGAGEGTVFLRYPGFSEQYGHKPHGRGQMDFSQVRNVSELPPEAADNPAIGQEVLHLRWEFLPEAHPDAPMDYRYTRVRTVPYPPSHMINPTISFEHSLRFDIYTNEPLEVALLLRETHTTGDYGTDGGDSGAVKWIGGRNKIGDHIASGVPIPANQWVTLEFNIPVLGERALARTGSGPLNSLYGKGVLEAFAFMGAPGTSYDVYMDNITIVPVDSHPPQAHSELSQTPPEPGVHLWIRDQ